MITKEQWDELKSAEAYGMYVNLHNRVEALENSFRRNNADYWKAIADIMKELEKCKLNQKKKP